MLGRIDEAVRTGGHRISLTTIATRADSSKSALASVIAQGTKVRRLVIIAYAMLAAIAAAACREPPRSADMVARGRFIYMERCVVCHNRDPNLPGSQGPPIAGSSRELVADRVLHLKYPPGYVPKRKTHAMKAMPELAPDIGAITAYLDAAAQPPRQPRATPH
jgi:mono/diheme cytochrome c family protein